MRRIEYLSPSAIQKWINGGVEAFYLHYLADNRPPREPQTEPMSVGSSFDAYVKSYLHEKLFGKRDAQFEFDTIFAKQVEPQNRDFARRAGKHCFDEYQRCGALLDLLLDLQSAQREPRFEFDVCGTVAGTMPSGDVEVTLLGKPDAWFVNKHGVHVILDWKVNGYCSKWPKSPTPGYVRLRGDGRSHGQHKNCSPLEFGGMTINIGSTLEFHEQDWARQLAIYAWLLGEPIGGDFIVAIDQLACKPGVLNPTIMVAEHRLRIGKTFQQQTFETAANIWDIVRSEHIFRDMTLSDSKRRCEGLEQHAESIYGVNANPLFREMTR